MTTVNAFLERDWCCGFNLWTHCTWPFSDVRVYGFGNDNLGKKFSKGTVPHEKILTLLSHAGVYLNPSIASPIPMSLLEAIAVGVPIVTTSFYEPGILFQNNVHGIVSNDPVDLREGIKYMLENPVEAQKMAGKAREVVKEKFTLSSFVENWKNVFNKVIIKP
jgi:glycosyltransferase involved in cell wall biosynthesis